ncbi:hypothetical protein PO250_01315 [Limosilactobacillus mucosae]|uniref:Uncharacterized protein n=1 Tax=Limosilactobacillus mucosae TaxID=97478 RepID=A0AAJ1HUZ9_LIMMU|nr:hypothetical protein [Limosilactobacillus mucosae]MDC2828975.1 hypothetical protein [Limosilactobacillus mucosae]
MKPVNREEQLRANAKQAPKIKVAKPHQKSANGPAVHKAKNNAPAENIFRPSKKEHNNRKRKAAGVPARYKVAGAGLAGLAVLGVGVAAYSGHENDSQQTKATSDNDKASTTADYSMSSDKNGKKHTTAKTKAKDGKHHKKSSSSKETMNLNDLLNDSKSKSAADKGDNSDNGKSSKSKSDNNLDSLLKVAGISGDDGLGKLASEADKSQEFANSLGNDSNKQNANNNNGFTQLASSANSAAAAPAQSAAPQPQPIPSVPVNGNTGSATTPTTPAVPSSGSASTPTTPTNPSSGSASTPTTPTNPSSGSASTPTTPTNPSSGSASTPTTPTNPSSGSASTPTTPTNPSSGSSTPITPDTPNSGAPSNPDSGSSAPSSQEPQPITQDTSVDTHATTGTTTDASQTANRVPIAENVSVAGTNGTAQPSQQPNISGVGVPQAGDYIVTGEIKTADGHTVTVNKSIHVEDNANLKDDDANTSITQTATAEPVTIKTGQTVKLFDSLTAKTAAGQELSGLGNGGITFNSAGSYAITYTVGNVRIVKNVTVIN